MKHLPRRAALATALSVVCLGLMSFGGIGTPSAMAATETGIIGADNRTQVTNTTTYPNSGIVQILRFDTPQCTGALISPNVVLTAAHCLKFEGVTWDLRAYKIVPGRNGSSQPYATCGVTQSYLDPQWTGHTAAAQYDWALLRLDCNIGQTTGQFKVKAGTFTGQTATVRGYARDKALGTLWTHSGPITQTDTNELRYQMDQVVGQSGGPVFTADNQIVGVSTGSYSCGPLALFCSPYNFAARLTAARVSTINSYVSAWACTPVVRVWSDVDLAGSSYAYCPGQIIPTAATGIPGLANDTMSSLEILDPAWEVTLYEHSDGLTGFGSKLGPMMDRPLTYNLPAYNFNDKASAISITPASNSILLYRDTNPGSGAPVITIPPGVVYAPTMPVGLDETISAIVVPQGRSISIFQNTNYGGDWVLFFGPGFHNLTDFQRSMGGGNWNDQMSSYVAG